MLLVPDLTTNFVHFLKRKIKIPNSNIDAYVPFENYKNPATSGDTDYRLPSCFDCITLRAMDFHKITFSVTSLSSGLEPSAPHK